MRKKATTILQITFWVVLDSPNIYILDRKNVEKNAGIFKAVFAKIKEFPG